MNAGIMKAILALVVYLATFYLAKGATCEYKKSENTLTCGGITCDTSPKVYKGKIESGTYLLGSGENDRKRLFFELYPPRTRGTGFWDTRQGFPERKCRKYYRIHNYDEGTFDSVKIADDRCFSKIRSFLLDLDYNSTTVYACQYLCHDGACLGLFNEDVVTNEVDIIGDLLVH